MAQDIEVGFDSASGEDSSTVLTTGTIDQKGTVKILGTEGMVLGVDIQDKDQKHGLLVYNLGRFSNGILDILEGGGYPASEIVAFREKVGEVQKAYNAELKLFGTW